jgi:diguanylate cyclase (GGDEF)-like protein
LCKEATRIAVEEGGLPLALLVELSPESDRLTVLCAHSADRQLQPVQLSDVEVDVIRESLRQNKVIVHNDLARYNNDPALHDKAALGITAVTVFPLVSDEEPVATAFILYRNDAIAFDEPEMKLLQEVSGDISFAIANLRKNQQLEQLTHYDSVTELPNRLLLTDRLQQAMIWANNHQSVVSILFVDIDRFKQVNDSLGHTAGDAVLQQVAQRIGSCLQSTDTSARWGSDEFIVMLPGQSDAEAAEVANAITGSLHSPLQLDDGRELYASCSIGIACCPVNGRDIDALISSATSAATTIKALGGNDYRHFTLESDKSPEDRLALETSLRHALTNDEFQLHYQPQLDVASGEMIGLEALLRWHHPTLGMIAPDRFIPLAETTGLIVPIGEWVLREACRQGATEPTLKIAVNLSARQFHQKDLVPMIARILQETGIRPANLELEITETALIYDVESAITTMMELMDLNVSISLDDFGTGYSSLSYLKRFPIDTLKIDKSFIAEVTTDPGSKVIVNTIILMAHSLGLKVIAEGVETEEQFAMLRERGCDQAQGYLFARPLPFQEALEKYPPKE